MIVENKGILHDSRHWLYMLSPMLDIDGCDILHEFLSLHVFCTCGIIGIASGDLVFFTLIRVRAIFADVDVFPAYEFFFVVTAREKNPGRVVFDSGRGDTNIGPPMLNSGRRRSEWFIRR